MLNWVITFLMLAIIASLVGFLARAGAFAEFSEVLAIVFIALFAGTLICGIIKEH